MPRQSDVRLPFPERLLRAPKDSAWRAWQIDPDAEKPQVSLKSLDPAAKVEADHELVWLHPHTALNELRHDAHAWAVAVWLRRHS